MSVRLEIFGDGACFTRPEMKGERVSYDVITPSAARGILEAIFWHPGLRYTIDRIHVCNPIVFSSVRRNEVGAKMSSQTAKSVMLGKRNEFYIASSAEIVQRATMYLSHVHYVIDAHFDMTDKASPTDNEGKFQEMLTRRIAKGQCYHPPYFGCREFPVTFRPCEKLPLCPSELLGEHDLGYMLYDMAYEDAENIRPLFYRAVMRDGVIEVPPRDSGEVKG